MLGEGKTTSQIAEALGVDYWEASELSDRVFDARRTPNLQAIREAAECSSMSMSIRSWSRPAAVFIAIRSSRPANGTSSSSVSILRPRLGRVDAGQELRQRGGLGDALARRRLLDDGRIVPVGP